LNLTDLTIRKLPAPPTGQKAYYDDSIKGFGIRVSSKGTKTFTLLYGDPRKRMTIGRYPILTLSQARTEAKRILAKDQLGISEPVSMTFLAAYNQFKQQHMTTYAKTTFKAYARYYELHCTKLFHRPLHTLEIKDITSIIDKLKPSEANHTFRAIRTFLNWCKKRGIITSAPTDVLSQPYKEKTRDRFLTDAEIQALWKNTDYSPFGTFVRMLLLTGARRAEVATLKLEHINDETISFLNTKNKLDHHLPITALTKIHLEKMASNTPYLFPANRAEKPISGFAKMKEILDKKMDIPHWTLHDLRRTTATHMAQLQVQPHIIERVLNHSTGTISGLGKIYNRHTYFNEMKSALTLWHSKILVLAK
jgi:integrase